MKNPRSSLLPLLLAAAGLLALVPASRVQAQLSPRFAFADTTLLRDTLGLRFDRLFETADSLGVLPDSLRAHIIRFRLPMARLVFMADSMGVPVDSVGAVIARERFNPFARGATLVSKTTFRYTSDYTIGRNSTVWANTGDYSMQRGKLGLVNFTEVTLDRATASNILSLDQKRASRTEASWRLSPGFFMSGRALLSRYDAGRSGFPADQRETKQEYQVSSRTQQKYSKDLTSTLNLSTGYLDLENLGTLKRGLSGDFNGNTRLRRGDWLTHDLSGGVNGNLSQTRRPASLVSLATRDVSSSLRGGLQLYQAAPVSLNANYSASRTQVEAPTDAEIVSRLLTSRASADATLRLRASNDRYLSITANAGRNAQLTGTRVDQGVRSEARWVQGPWAFLGQFQNTIGDTRAPRRNGQYGYEDRQDNRTASGEVTRAFGRKIVAKLTGNISLLQARSKATADSANPPTPRDNYRQSYRAQANYNPAEKFASSVALEVGLARAINLPASSTSNNTDTRSYRAEWSWNYRLLRGLTASQTNTVTADYQFYPFASDRNNVTLDYGSFTKLTAILTPRLDLDIVHNARQQPRGDWRVLSDGSGVLLPSDENLNYALRSTVTWRPSPALALTMTPEYQANDRNGTVNGAEAPTRKSRRLNFTGGANLDLKLGKSGAVEGRVGRTFTADRSTTFLNGLPQDSPVSERDFWNGYLRLSWDL